jgi:hypothetical protein
MHILKTLIITLLLPVIAHAIPLSVLQAQEQEREDIILAIRTLDKDCAACREQIVVALRHYIAGKQANINFCRRARGLGGDDRDTDLAIMQYQVSIACARAEIRIITRKDP